MTQPKFKIKKGDLVMVRVGKEKGKQGKVQKVLLDESKVVIEGINKVVRHMRPSYANPGGTVEKNLPIHISNVALVDPSGNAFSKVGVKEVDGKRVRYFKKSGNLV